MSIATHRYGNGLTLVVEPIGGVNSVGMTWLLPAGAATEPAGKLGVGTVLGEMVLRGAGELDARGYPDALDLLGVHRSTEVQTHHIRLGATFLGDRLDAAIPLLFDAIRRPHLREQDFAPSVQLALQSIEALEDEPQEKVMIELRRRHLGDPLGRSSMGDAEHLKAMGVGDVRAFAASRFVPGGSVLGFAGNVSFEHVRDRVGELLGDMRGEAAEIDADATPHGPHGYLHIKTDSTQQHIGLAYETVGEADPAGPTQRVATAVLSGGMSGRLFTEVREVRGLCYSVYAAYAPRRTTGTIYAYAGTTTQRAAETLEVLSRELRRMSEGVALDEFERAVVGLKARLVMQGESTSARAKAISYDQYLLGRPRSLAERTAEVQGVTLAGLNRFLASHPPEGFTTLTIGPEPLPVEKGVFSGAGEN